MSCISSNFSSFFLDSLNDPSEFAKYLSNGENKFSPFEDFQVQQQQPQQQQHFNGSYYNNNNNNTNAHNASAIGQMHNNCEQFNGIDGNSTLIQQPTTAIHQQQQQQHQHQSPYASQTHPSTSSFQHNELPLPAQMQPNTANNHHHPHQHLQQHPHPHHAHAQQQQLALHTAAGVAQGYTNTMQRWCTSSAATTSSSSSVAHFDGSFEFLKYLRHSNDYSSSSTSSNSSSGASNSNHSADDTIAASSSTSSSSSTATITIAASNCQTGSSLIDLDTSTSMKPRSAPKAAALLSSATRAAATLGSTLDVFEHDDSKHTIFELQQNHITHSSNEESSSMDVSNLAFPNSLLNASNSNTSSEGATGGNADFSNINAAAIASAAPKPLANVVIQENFEVHPAHKVEEGIFQHMNKLPSKKKENLKQLGVRFTGQMTLADKSIIADNFIRFCQEYEISDHRPYLSLNQSGLNKPEQIKFARYLGQGLPSFTLFCIYSNFKNLFCTKRIETYTKDGYNLPYILEKTKRFLANTTAGTTITPNKQTQTSHQPTSVITYQQQQQQHTQMVMSDCHMH